jgi:adenylate cyclase
MPSAENRLVELELTYLARNIPKEILDTNPFRLLDIYLPETKPRPFIRLRKKGDEYEITKKQPISDNDYSEQTEQTISLDREEFNTLATVSKLRLEKDRYKVNLEGSAAEIDVFHGDLEGLVLIDFEFNSSEAKQSFTPPACCLAEVTQEIFIAGGQLAGKNYSDIEKDLNRYGYKKLSK